MQPPSSRYRLAGTRISRPRSLGARYGVALSGAALAVLIRYLLDPWLGNHQAFLTAYGAVALAVWFGGWQPAVLAAVALFLVSIYLFFPPSHELASDFVGLAALVGYSFSCGAIIGLGELLHRARARAERDAERLNREVGERRSALEALRQNEERLRLATQTGKVGVWDWDIIANRILWTDSLYSIHGIEKDEFSGTVEGFAALVHPDDRDFVSQAIERSLAEGAPYELEFRAIKPDRQVVWLFTNALLLRSAGKPYRMLGATVDITERKMAEAEREQLLGHEREARRAAEEANRLKDELLATLSHELRNPLNVILGSSEILLRTEEIQRSQPLLRLGEALRRNALAQSQLISDLLDLSRLQSGKLTLDRKKISLTRIIYGAVETVRDEAAVKNIAISIDIPESPLIVEGDALRLEQVAWNLLNNAVKFTPAGGSVRVRLCRQQDEALLKIEDSGQGIDPEFLPHVFEMFRQADGSISRRQAGLGIGLSLVRRLVELHSGSVRASSEGHGRGAQFIVSLPLSREASMPSSPEPRDRSGALDQIRALVIDDSRDSVDMLRYLLETEGALVMTATSGVEALQLAAAREFDVILSDIAMPEIDGFELLRRLRSIPGREDVPVVALSGLGRPQDIERTQREGFFSHLTKPIDCDRLSEILRKAPLSRRKR